MITKYFIDKAKYKAIDENGNVIWLKINYWQGKYEISQNNEQLETFAKKLLAKKHRVNLVYKMIE